MKKIILAACLFALISGSAAAQSFFIKAGGGYAFPSAGQTLNVSGLPFSGNATFTQAGGFTNYEIKDVSLTAGAQAIIGACYLFNNNFGIAVDANIMLAPAKLEARNAYETSNSDNVDERSTHYAKQAIVLHPALYMQTSMGKLGMYARGGLAVSMGTRIVREDVAVIIDAASGASQTYNITQEFSTNTRIGFSGAIGVKYPVAKYVNIWAESNLQSLSLYVEEATYTNFVVNGQSLLSQLPPQVRTTQYSRSRSNSAQPAFSFPYSSMALNVGVSFDF